MVATSVFSHQTRNSTGFATNPGSHLVSFKIYSGLGESTLEAMDEAQLRRQIESAEKAARDLAAAVRAAKIAMGTDACSPTFARRLWRCFIYGLRSIAYYALYLVDMCLAVATFGIVVLTLTAVVVSGVWLATEIFFQGQTYYVDKICEGFRVACTVLLVSTFFLNLLAHFFNAPSFLVVGARYSFRCSVVYGEYVNACMNFLMITLGYKWVLSCYFERKFY